MEIIDELDAMLDELNELETAILQGLSFRQVSHTQEKKGLHVKASPLNIPFKLCRAACKKKRKSKPQPESINKRETLTQKEYMNLLSLPQRKKPEQICPKTKKKKKKKKKCKKCHIEPCPPRLVQISVPNKRLVWENWKAYYNILPPEIIMRYDHLLRSGNNNLDPKDARYYFKTLDRQKRKNIRRKKAMQSLKKDKAGDAKWENLQIKETVDVIEKSIRQQQLLVLNYRQLQISNEIIDTLVGYGFIKHHIKRTCRKTYPKTVYQISDKVAELIDCFYNYVDILPLDSTEAFPVLMMPSLQNAMDQEEEEYVSEEEDEFESLEEYEGSGEGSVYESIVSLADRGEQTDMAENGFD